MVRPSLVAIALATPFVALSAGCADDGSLGASTSSSATETGGESTSDSASETGSASGSETSASGSATETEGMTETETGDPACDISDPELVEQTYLSSNESATGVELGACENHVWWASAAAGTELTVEFTPSAPIEVSISYPDTPSFEETFAANTLYDPGSLSFTATRSGEFAINIRPLNPDQDPALVRTYDIELSCTNQCGRETTRFPIVMVHGWTGFENIGPLTYFYGVQDDLEDLGYPLAIAVLDPYNSVDVRGEQLAEFVGSVLQNQRARKVNLFGHSQGGIDSRYVAAEAGGGYGDRVGAVITLGTPHYGTPFTDIALGLIPGQSELALAFLFNFLGATMDQESDVLASLETLSETFMQDEFNVIYVDDPRVKYYSWMGETCPAGLGCNDILDPLLLLSYEMIFAVAGANDGLVPESSAEWGEYLGLIPADHIDQIGQIAGITGQAYDHIEFFRDNARMLKDEEF